MLCIVVGKGVCCVRLCCEGVLCEGVLCEGVLCEGVLCEGVLCDGVLHMTCALLIPCDRKNHGRQLESLQQSLEEESKAKNEQIRLKKVAEGQIDELHAAIDAGEKV